MQLYDQPEGVRTRWHSPENPYGAPGGGGTVNRGAKGRPCVSVPAGATHTMLDCPGSGTVCRIWATLSDRSPEMLRGLRLEMYWDDAPTPAVCAPFGDFFGVGLGRRTPFECALFSDPEGRSFNCFVPMPFRDHARIVVVNESGRDLSHFFYDVDLLTAVVHGPHMRYFHAGWRRESPNALGREFLILPPVPGHGRFLGCNLGVVVDPRYGGAWWGEGEVKIRIGGERLPTLCGTGTEDYIGTAWGQGTYGHRTQGCLVGDDARGLWAFYRYHLDDPVYFEDGCQVAIQTIGGTAAEKVVALQDAGVPLVPTTLDGPAPLGIRLLQANEASPDLRSLDHAGAWCNFWRQDDWSATAYFYLDRPEGVLPPLASPASRMAGLAGAGSGTESQSGDSMPV